MGCDKLLKNNSPDSVIFGFLTEEKVVSSGSLALIRHKRIPGGQKLLNFPSWRAATSWGWHLSGLQVNQRSSDVL